MTEPPAAAPLLRVLLVDDDATVLALTSRLLEARGFKCWTVQDPRQALDETVRLEPDVVLLDVHMEPISGAAVLGQLRSDFRTALTPVICVTSDTDPATLIALLGEGADDYLGKGADPDELQARILVATRRRAVLGSVNPLTGLAGNIVLTAAIEHRLRTGDVFALLHVDIDNFKAHNDCFGFVRGDEAITALGQMLRATVAKVGARNCLLAHIGGDDFAILVDAEHAELIAEAVLAAFDALVPELYEPADFERGHVLTTDRRGELREHPLLSLSIGIATTRHRAFSSPAAMADIAGEVKGVAKCQTGSAFVVDRRRS